MRALILVAGAGLALAACGDKSATDADANASANLASEAIFANDTTVIDAATGDAANMAADVVYTGAEPDDGGGDVSSSGTIDRRTVSRRQSSPAEPASNTADDAAPMESVAESNSL